MQRWWMVLALLLYGRSQGLLEGYKSGSRAANYSQVTCYLGELARGVLPTDWLMRWLARGLWWLGSLWQGWEM